MITILAFGVGLLLGPRLCAPVDQDAPVTSSQIEKEERLALDGASTWRDADMPDLRDMDPVAAMAERCPETKIIYQCPPAEPVKEEEKKKGVKTNKKASLPPPEPELDPLLRKRLLAWVRDRSDTLAACRDDRQEIYRMAVIMHLDAESARVTRVSVNASRGVVPASVLTCVRQKVQQWRPPSELTQGRTQLVFGLNI